VSELPDSELPEKKQRLPLEKGDFPAIVMAALITVGPIVLVLIALVVFVGWVFGAFSP